MEYRNLGKTGARVPALGFGLWPIGGTHVPTGYGGVDDDDAIAAIRRALDLGVSLFDAAPIYGTGRAEELLARALGSRRKEAFVVTKCDVHWDFGQQTWVMNSSYDEVYRSVEASLERLQTDFIDLLLIHVPDPERSFEEPMRAMSDLKRAGAIRFGGVSNFSVEQLGECLKFGDVDAQEIHYHVFDRRIEGQMLPFCREHGIGVIGYGTLAFGLLTGTFMPQTTFPPEDWRSAGDAFGLPLFTRANLPTNARVVGQLAELARQRGKTVTQLAIAWALREPGLSVALTGARRPQEIEDNVGGVGWKLSPRELEAIDEIMKGAAASGGPFDPIYKVAGTSD